MPFDDVRYWMKVIIQLLIGQTISPSNISANERFIMSEVLELDNFTISLLVMNELNLNWDRTK